MEHWPIAFAGLAALAFTALLVWLFSLRLRNVAIVDSVWPLMFLIAAGTYGAAGLHSRGALLLVLVAVWALRLAIYITWRNWGHGEDRRYQAIRARNQPHFALKSLYLIFFLQAALAWLIAMPLFAAMQSARPLGLLDGLGAVLWLIGFIFEAGGDWQLAHFKADPANQGRVMDRGLWHYTRHPNYFGDFCVWWGFGLIALAAGAWWSLFGPALMSFLLTRVSGVRLLETDIGERRPGYASYVRRTNAFFPGLPKAS